MFKLHLLSRLINLVDNSYGAAFSFDKNSNNIRRLVVAWYTINNRTKTLVNRVTISPADSIIGLHTSTNSSYANYMLHLLAGYLHDQHNYTVLPKNMTTENSTKSLSWTLIGTLGKSSDNVTGLPDHQFFSFRTMPP
ncbi:MAG: hypothetical protein KDH94_05040 [Coxiellaceae bacterium]|nr:hypothetical protein [Coxiellaceae bacterium]